jgi:hypothetical protein
MNALSGSIHVRRLGEADLKIFCQNLRLEFWLGKGSVKRRIQNFRFASKLCGNLDRWQKEIVQAIAPELT